MNEKETVEISNAETSVACPKSSGDKSLRRIRKILGITALVLFAICAFEGVAKLIFLYWESYDACVITDIGTTKSDYSDLDGTMKVGNATIYLEHMYTERSEVNSICHKVYLGTNDSIVYPLLDDEDGVPKVVYDDNFEPIRISAGGFVIGTLGIPLVQVGDNYEFENTTEEIGEALEAFFENIVELDMSQYDSFTRSRYYRRNENNHLEITCVWSCYVESNIKSVDIFKLEKSFKCIFAYDLGSDMKTAKVVFYELNRTLEKDPADYVKGEALNIDDLPIKTSTNRLQSIAHKAEYNIKDIISMLSVSPHEPKKLFIPDPKTLQKLSETALKQYYSTDITVSDPTEVRIGTYYTEPCLMLRYTVIFAEYSETLPYNQTRESRWVLIGLYD